MEIMKVSMWEEDYVIPTYKVYPPEKIHYSLKSVPIREARVKYIPCRLQKRSRIQKKM